MADPDARLLARARPQRLAETVSQRILALVRAAEPGGRLPSVRALADGFGVSPSTVREALQSLAALGVIDIRHGRGIFVGQAGAGAAAGRDAYTREELLEARHAIDPELARLAAERRTAEELAALEGTLAEHAADLAAGRRPDVHASRFHRQVADAARSRTLADAVAPFYRAMIERGPDFYGVLPGYPAWELAMHREILAAIRSGDGTAAAAAMRRHIAEMEEHYRSQPDLEV